MALEAGSAMHDVFAAVRLWQLEHVQKLPSHATHHAARLLSSGRWKNCKSKMKDRRDNLVETAINILHSTGFMDDPDDKVRTLTNMELAAIRYIDSRLENMELFPIWVADKKQHDKPVGIEHPFDITLQFDDGYECRYIGTIDGLVFDEKRKRYTLDENKTASRLDDAWERSFDMSHQITGYCAASTTVFGFKVLSSRVTGLKFKPTQFEDVNIIYPLQRDAYAINHFGQWVRHGAEVFDLFRDNWEEAPRYTHSCSRYFRPCSLINFCCDTPEGRQQQWKHDMIEAPLSPSELAILEMGS